MKHLMIATLLACATLPAQAETIKVSVNGMVCAFCAQGIEKRLSKLPSVSAVYVDLKAKIVAVESSSGNTLDAKAIETEIKDAGYDVVKLETTEQSLAEIKAQVKKR